MTHRNKSHLGDNWGHFVLLTYFLSLCLIRLELSQQQASDGSPIIRPWDALPCATPCTIAYDMVIYAIDLSRGNMTDKLVNVKLSYTIGHIKSTLSHYSNCMGQCVDFIGHIYTGFTNLENPSPGK